MRILQIRFKNLNSLVGEWEIDLTHPAFVSDGIFAITGPTGAGKTTILDAICLALYGRTPRLNRVTKSANEIMSRHTGECFSEVVFETQAGRFRCHWSQHRARKNPNGELQPPKQEIADADSGLIFEAKFRGVAEQIEQATGMDFDRFIRSMLLAQGGFSTFLQAAPDERAPILEQITGTEIYSHLSIEVHKRRTAEKTSLELLHAEFAGMHLLSLSDELQFKLDLEQKMLQEAGLNQQLIDKNQAVAWLDDVSRLESESRLIDAQKQDLSIRQEKFKPELIKLQRANQALELAGEHAELLSLRREQETDQRNHKASVQALPAQTLQVSQAEKILNTAVDCLEKNKIEQKESLIVIRNVRELDLKYQEKITPFKLANEAIADLVSDIQKLRLKHAMDLDAYRLKTMDFDLVMNQINETKADEALVEHLAGIKSRFETRNQLSERHGLAVNERAEAEKQEIQSTQAWTIKTADLEKLKHELQDIQDKLIQKKTLKIDDTDALRMHLSVLNQKKERLNNLSELTSSLADARRNFDEQERHYETLAAERVPLAQQLQVKHEKTIALEREIQLLETQLSLLKKIQSFEVARQQLHDGESCPLCGAKDHPFAEGNRPLPDETSILLNQARLEFKITNNALSALKINQAELLKDLEQITLFKTQLAEKIALTDEQICHSMLELAVAPTFTLQMLQQENADQIITTTNAISVAEMLDKDITILRETYDKTKESIIDFERDTQTAAHQKEMVVQSAERAKKAAEALWVEIQQITNDLQHEISPYGVNVMTADALVDLTSRRRQWLLRHEKKSALEPRILSLKIDTQHQFNQISTTEILLQKQQERAGILERELNNLAQQRRELYGDSNPDQVEAGLLQNIEDAEKKLEVARQTHGNAFQELDRIKHRIEEFAQLIELRLVRLNLAERSFQARLKTCGFADEASYLASCLPEDERRQRMQQASQLDRELTELEAKRRDIITSLTAARQKNLTAQTIDELKLELINLVQQQRGLQHDIGGIRQKLIDNENLKLRQQDRIKAIENQKKECSRWNILHELIGSVDGKKYRNFAQGLTFEMMIGHANRQLLKMTDRYLLSRDQSQPLELNVVDNYQAGEIRSTKNLSGGESFIVSLCLALGLSQMSSKNVRVDSLFLDEGFGTLDDDALDTALETLAGLHQDGKLIGMISHVSALKERISTQIHVTPKTGGRSVISGFGCRLVDNSDS